MQFYFLKNIIKSIRENLIYGLSIVPSTVKINMTGFT